PPPKMENALSITSGSDDDVIPSSIAMDGRMPPSQCPHGERTMSGSGILAVPSSPPRIVDISPPDIARRQLANWGRIQADNVRITRRETFEDGFQAQRHLLIAYESP